MKRLSIITVLSIFMITSLNAKTSIFQDEAQEVTETAVDSSVAEVTPVMETVEETPVVEEVESANFHQELKKRFIEGGPGFMGIVLLCLILGLAIAIERIIYLNLATSNSDKLTSDVEDALKSGGLDAAKEVCRNTPGPVASIFYQGLDRAGGRYVFASKLSEKTSPWYLR